MISNQLKPDQSTSFFGLTFFSKDMASLLTHLRAHLVHSTITTYIFTPNPEQLVLAHHDPGFRQALTEADWCIPDGQGLIWAANYLAEPGAASGFTQRIPGVDVVGELLQVARDQKLKVAIVGGRGYEAPLQAWHETYGQALAWLPGYRQVSDPTEEEEEQVTAWLESQKPDLLFVAFGAPYQEYWLVTHRDLLEEINCKLAMPVGGSFDYILGIVPRAPGWMQAIGLEWAFRLAIQPWRWKRQLRLVEFVWLVLTRRLG